MASIEPLPLRVVHQSFADRVPSPAHDSLTPEGRRQALRENPDSFLAVTRSIEDLDPSLSITDNELLQLGRASLDRLLDLGAFEDERLSQFYVYQLESKGHQQTGLVAGVATSDFVQGKVRVHEQILHDRAAHLAHQLAIVRVQSSPIALAHLPVPPLRAILDRTMTQSDPARIIASEPDFTQRIWPIDRDLSASIVELLSDDPLYLIDGHHRGAAAIDYRRLVGPGTADMTLCALFPTDELTNFAFHRVLPPSIGAANTVAALTAQLARRIDGPHDIAVGDSSIAMFDGETSGWWALTAPRATGVAPSLADLAPTRLASRFDEVLGTVTPDEGDGVQWRDLVRYRPGILSLEVLTAEASERNDALFILPPLRIDALIAVANDGLSMPPKSTYFDPKVRSGVFLRHL